MCSLKTSQELRQVAENIVEIVMLQIGRHYTDVDDNDVDLFVRQS